MLKNIATVVIGVVLGGAFYIAVRKFIPNNKTMSISKTDSDSPKLFEDQLIIEMLNGEDLSSWFILNQQITENNPEVKKIISYPNSDILESIGLKLPSKNDKDNYLLQAFYNEKENEIIKMRFINFQRLNPELEELLSKNGMIVVD